MIVSRNKNILDKVVIALLVFLSVTPLFENILVLPLSTILVVVLWYLRKNNFRIYRYNLLVLIYFSLLYVPYSLFLDFAISSQLDFLTTLGFLAFLINGFIISALVSRQEILGVILSLTKISLLLGIPIWIIVLYMPDLLSTLPNYTFSGHTHKTLFIVNFLQNSEILYGRFTGFAREPGLMQMLYLLAFIHQMNTTGGVISFTSLLIILGIVLGASTTGLLLFVFLFFVKVKFYHRQSFFILLFLFVLFPFIFDLVSYQLEFKLIGSDSFNYRYDTYDYLFSTDLSNLIFGVGNYSYINNVYPKGMGGWDTFLQFTQRLGFVNFFFISIILLFSNKRSIDIFLVIFVSFFSQIIWFYPLVAFFYFREWRESFVSRQHM